jgi:hypothetical protein
MMCFVYNCAQRRVPLPAYRQGMIQHMTSRPLNWQSQADAPGPRRGVVRTRLSSCFGRAEKHMFWKEIGGRLIQFHKHDLDFARAKVEKYRRLARKEHGRDLQI